MPQVEEEEPEEEEEEEVDLQQRLTGGGLNFKVAEEFIFGAQSRRLSQGVWFCCWTAGLSRCVCTPFQLLPLLMSASCWTASAECGSTPWARHLQAAAGSSKGRGGRGSGRGRGAGRGSGRGGGRGRK